MRRFSNIAAFFSHQLGKNLSGIYLHGRGMFICGKPVKKVFKDISQASLAIKHNPVLP
jgi:hypothetical protein